MSKEASVDLSLSPQPEGIPLFQKFKNLKNKLKTLYKLKNKIKNLFMLKMLIINVPRKN
jgi:hypothetical protein